MQFLSYGELEKKTFEKVKRENLQSILTPSEIPEIIDIIQRTYTKKNNKLCMNKTGAN